MGLWILTLAAFLTAFVSAGVHADEATPEPVMEKRQQNVLVDLGVYQFSSPDYAATVSIIGGVSLAFILAVVFIVVGLMSMEPNKDSIIYRMTTTRMKKD